MTCDALSGILESWLGVRWHTENVTQSHLKFKVNVRLLFSWRFAVFIRMFKIMIMYMHMLMYIHVSVHVCCFHFLVHITNHMCNTCICHFEHSKKLVRWNVVGDDGKMHIHDALGKNMICDDVEQKWYFCLKWAENCSFKEYKVFLQANLFLEEPAAPSNNKRHGWYESRNTVPLSLPACYEDGGEGRGLGNLLHTVTW